MRFSIPFFLEQALGTPVHVDRLLYYLLAVSAGFILLTVTAMSCFATRLRRRPEPEQPEPVQARWPLRFVWSVIPLSLTMIVFGWGASTFYEERRPPRDAMQIYVVAKQWVWKLQHMEGLREINELHVPVGRAVKLTMTSEDIPHSLFVPAFRAKQDIVPGRYTTTWFKATQPGKYRILCTENCGPSQAGMTGWVYAMEPKDYTLWLAGGPKGPLVEHGAKLFQDLACIKCHKEDGSGRCPSLRGLFGQTILLTGGATVEADEAYIRESIVDPAAKVVDGYQPLMPNFRDQVTEEDLVALVAYIKAQLRKPQGEFASQKP